MNTSLVLIVCCIIGYAAAAGLSKKEQQKILNQHNEFRASIKASDMVKLEWDNSLAKKAQDWADTCTLGHNPSHTISGKSWSWIGENMAFSTEKDLGNMVQMWQEEQQIFDYNSNQCNPHPSDPLLRACGHYTQMVWAKTHFVGCGVKLGCPGYLPNRLVCNYAIGGNMIGEKPYTSGKKCSACPDGFTSCKDNLCSKKSKPRRRRCFETPSDMEALD
ncbi:peptidase inhibitor R3HDML-like [Asterias amurensis]|uniref:peptidase inhibitor R3HDML-like n=1 Tax=Asterias amurensis TaxID=7602 RepID=UPI003AB210E2